MKENVWRKATSSEPDNTCLEVSRVVGEVLVRDSKDSTGPMLRFSSAAFHELMVGVSSRIGLA